jgi:hypothetical protein
MTTKATILKSIRSKCLDCSCYQPDEVKHCPVQRCALWPFRMGRDPNPSRMGVLENLPSRRSISNGNGHLDHYPGLDARPSIETSSYEEEV